MSYEHILKILRSDAEENEYVLVNVQSNGPKPLDLKLVATDGDVPYISTSEPLYLAWSLQRLTD